MNLPDVPRETSHAVELRGALERLAPQLDPRVGEMCERHFALLLTRNRTHNLTTVTDPQQAASVHYLDSLLPLLPLVPPGRVVDIGSGAGLPGLVAAALWPQSEVVLVESTAKKASFLRAAKAHIPGLEVRVIAQNCDRVESLQADLVLTRATFKWDQVPGHSARHLAPGGALLAYLGRAVPELESWTKSAASAGLVNAKLKQYQLPPDGVQRHVASAVRAAPGSSES